MKLEQAKVGESGLETPAYQEHCNTSIFEVLRVQHSNFEILCVQNSTQNLIFEAVEMATVDKSEHTNKAFSSSRSLVDLP
jgi:hypothetical protein